MSKIIKEKIPKNMEYYKVFFLKKDVLKEDSWGPRANKNEAEQIQNFLNSQAEQGWFLKQLVLYPGSSTDAIEDTLIILERNKRV